MIVQRVVMPVTDAVSWTVLRDGVPIEPVEKYLAYLAALERSPNTVRAHALSLRLWFEFLEAAGVDWAAVGVEDVARFIAWLRAPAENVIVQEGPLREHFEALARPERERLKAELPEARKALADLQGRRNAYTRFQYQHPEALHRLERLDEEMATAAWELDVERQGLDGIRPEPPQASAQRWAAARGIRGLDHGLDLGIDL